MLVPAKPQHKNIVAMDLGRAHSRGAVLQIGLKCKEQGAVLGSKGDLKISQLRQRVLP